MSEYRVVITTVSPGGDQSQIGSWDLPKVQNDNFEAHSDLGWHVFYALLTHKEVTVRIVQMVRPHLPAAQRPKLAGEEGK